MRKAGRQVNLLKILNKLHDFATGPEKCQDFLHFFENPISTNCLITLNIIPELARLPSF